MFDTNAGVLYYDADGAGGTAAIKVALHVRPHEMPLPTMVYCACMVSTLDVMYAPR